MDASFLGWDGSPGHLIGTEEVRGISSPELKSWSFGLFGCPVSFGPTFWRAINWILPDNVSTWGQGGVAGQDFFLAMVNLCLSP